jgi:hypothetical protein
MGEEPLVVVAGSIYLIGEVMEQLGLVEPARERGLNDWQIFNPKVKAGQ